MTQYTIDDPRFRIAAARRILHRNGCDSGVAGQVTMLAEGGDAFWTTPMDSFDLALATQAAKLDFGLGVLEGAMPMPAVMSFHAEIYRRRPEVKAIVHVHSHFLSVFVTADRLVGAYDLSAIPFQGRQATYADTGGDVRQEVARTVDALADQRVLLMRNHGAIIVAESLEGAVVDTLQLEQSARIHMEAVAWGGAEIPEPIQIARSAGSPYARPLTWQAHLARLRRSDPDLFAGVQD
jgi:L-fuculose-phosphate aldolase